MALEVTFYADPDGDRLPLSVQPELASWDRAASPSQVRLGAYLDHVRHVVEPELARVDGPVSLRLDVGLARSASLLDERDLDNYLFPLMVALDLPRGRINSVWGSKRHADASFVTVGAARVGAEDRDWAVTRTVVTEASASTTAYKEQIDRQLRGVVALPPGPVSLEVGYLVGPRRHWPNLWKPTIDALDQILGRTRPERLWLRSTVA